MTLCFIKTKFKYLIAIIFKYRVKLLVCQGINDWIYETIYIANPCDETFELPIEWLFGQCTVHIHVEKWKPAYYEYTLKNRK